MYPVSIEQKGQDRTPLCSRQGVDKVRCKKMPYTFIYNSFLFPFPWCINDVLCLRGKVEEKCYLATFSK